MASSVSIALNCMRIPKQRSEGVHRWLGTFRRPTPRGVLIERGMTALPAAVARSADAAERGTCVIVDRLIVDVHHARAQMTPHPARALERVRVDRCGQSVLGLVGEGDRFFVGFERCDRSHRPEDLFVKAAIPGMTLVRTVGR